ncbi:hypothetical protein VPH35_067493 [Triticum aestivum]|uniref:uncharacterized protein isoform X1 n=2 Tax=Triticum aestivum TaxID=4565 RepID=UPI001D015C93|nr:uncharacterized protein LOC123087200 isoform X1 [Triticum aestivum]
MVFLQRQRLEICGHNPCYLSCFDVMCYEHGCNDGEWELFLNHLLDKKVYVIEDWDSSYSTIETLMYYYGVRQPDDGTGEQFFKGECDASFDSVTNTASFSYIIWKDDEIVYSEVFSGLVCSSAVEAEMYAAYALLYKAEQLKIRKLLLWTNSRTTADVLTGEHPIKRGDEHCDFYLTLRAMRMRFSWFMVSWKPRELMFFADDLANLAKLPINDLPSAVKLALLKWASHLRGLPVFRVEWTSITQTAVKKFKNVILDDETYGVKGPDVYLVEVKEGRKLECLVALKQTLKPSQLTVALDSYDDKCDSFKEQLGTVTLKKSRKNLGSGPMPGTCSTFTSESLPALPPLDASNTSSTSKSALPPPDASNTSSTSKSALPPPDASNSSSTSKSVNGSPPSKNLMVVLDYSVPRDLYYDSGAFHVVFVTRSERESMTEEIPELTALGFVYFNDVRFPLNKVKKVNAQEGQK